MAGPRVFASHGDILESLSNLELTTVLDGGSSRRVIRPRGTEEEWLTAWVDLDGLWCDDPAEPGYVVPRCWEVDLPY